MMNKVMMYPEAFNKILICLFKNFARREKKKDNASNKAFTAFIFNEC